MPLATIEFGFSVSRLGLALFCAKCPLSQSCRLLTSIPDFRSSAQNCSLRIQPSLIRSRYYVRKAKIDLSPPQRFKHSLYQSAVRSVPQAQSRMDRSGGEPLPDVRRFLVHPCRFLVHRWISRLWLHLTAWNSQKLIANYVATVCISFFVT